MFRLPVGSACQGQAVAAPPAAWLDRGPIGRVQEIRAAHPGTPFGGAEGAGGTARLPVFGAESTIPPPAVCVPPRSALRCCVSGNSMQNWSPRQRCQGRRGGFGHYGRNRSQNDIVAPRHVQNDRSLVGTYRGRTGERTTACQLPAPCASDGSSSAEKCPRFEVGQRIVSGVLLQLVSSLFRSVMSIIVRSAALRMNFALLPECGYASPSRWRVRSLGRTGADLPALLPAVHRRTRAPQSGIQGRECERHPPTADLTGDKIELPSVVAVQLLDLDHSRLAFGGLAFGYSDPDPLAAQKPVALGFHTIGLSPTPPASILFCPGAPGLRPTTRICWRSWR
jgi:hypothetical protein